MPAKLLGGQQPGHRTDPLGNCSTYRFVNSGSATVGSELGVAAKLTEAARFEKALSVAKVAVLLVSHNFLASQFINENELPRLLDAAQLNGVKILWIAVSSSLYKASPLSQFQAVNDPDKPLDSLSGPALNRQLVKIAESILERAILQTDTHRLKESSVDEGFHRIPSVLMSPKIVQENRLERTRYEEVVGP